MTTSIHPTAVVDPRAQLGARVEIGPYCVVGADVVVGDDTRLVAHVFLQGPAELGARNLIYPFAVIGTPPQDRGYDGEPTRVRVGNDNINREHATIHRGTAKGAGVTTVGSSNLLMVGVHVAHDVQLRDHVILTNGTLLGGHVLVQDWVVTAGGVAVAPFTRIGESAFIAGGAMVERDVPPFMITAGDRARVRALNRVGLARRAVPYDSCRALKAAFKILFLGSGTRAQLLDVVNTQLGTDPYVERLVAFMRATIDQDRASGR